MANNVLYPSVIRLRSIKSGQFKRWGVICLGGVKEEIESEGEEDGRWIAEIPDLPGVMVYRQNREEATSNVKALALGVLADRLEHGEMVPDSRL